MLTTEPIAGAPLTHIPEVSTLRTMKDRILASCHTALEEMNVRIAQAETTESDLRRQLEDQFIRTLLPSHEVMIPARRLYALLATVTQSYSNLAYAVESAIQDRKPEPPDVYETFFRFQEIFNGMLEDLTASEVLTDPHEFSYLNEYSRPMAATLRYR